MERIKIDKKPRNIERLNTILANHILDSRDDSNLGRLNRIWARWHLEKKTHPKNKLLD